MAGLVLITGANNSGKSIYAESIISHTIGKRYYIATMLPCTEENHRRIAKHRAQRKDLGFETLELPYKVGNAPIAEDSVVLLEDVSNLLANAVFENDNDEDYVFKDICSLLSRSRLLIVVTISGLEDEGYDKKTAEYIKGLNRINSKLFECADVVIAMEDKVPKCKKGDIHNVV